MGYLNVKNTDIKTRFARVSFDSAQPSILPGSCVMKHVLPGLHSEHHDMAA